MDADNALDEYMSKPGLSWSDDQLFSPIVMEPEGAFASAQDAYK